MIWYDMIYDTLYLAFWIFDSPSIFVESFALHIYECEWLWFYINRKHDWIESNRSENEEANKWKQSKQHALS